MNYSSCAKSCLSFGTLSLILSLHLYCNCSLWNNLLPDSHVNLIQLLTELLASSLHIVSCLHLNTLAQVLPITRPSLCIRLPVSQHIYYLLADKCWGNNPCPLLNQGSTIDVVTKFSIWKTKPLSLALLCCIESENKAVVLPFFFFFTLQHLYLRGGAL